MKFRRGTDKAGLVLLFFVLLGIGALALGWWRHVGFATVPMAGIQAGDTLLVQRGDSLSRVVDRLRAQGVRTGPALQWQLLARQMDAAGRLQVGEYALAPDTTPRALLQAMRDGKVLRRMFTIVEGWNIRDLRAALAKAEGLQQRTATMDAAALMQALGQPGQHPEGRFLPETYVYTRGDSELDVLRRAHGERATTERFTARLLTLQTAFGAAKMALESPEDAAVLRRRVTSPGGTTERALQTFEDGALRDLVLRALTAARDRSCELADQLGK